MNRNFNTGIETVRPARLNELMLPHDGDQKNHFKGLQAGLLDAAQAEVRDAIADLRGPGINPDVQAHLVTADQTITDANSNSSWNQRLAKAQTALAEVQAANVGLGTGLDMNVGFGSLMF